MEEAACLADEAEGVWAVGEVTGVEGVEVQIVGDVQVVGGQFGVELGRGEEEAEGFAGGFDPGRERFEGEAVWGGEGHGGLGVVEQEGGARGWPATKARVARKASGVR